MQDLGGVKQTPHPYFPSHCNTVKNKLQCSSRPEIFQCIPTQEVYIDQCKPADNSKINFAIIRRFTLTNVNLLTIVKFYYCWEVYIDQCKPLDNRKKFTIVKRFPLVNVNLLTIFIFFTITMAVAQSWLGGIGKYPPHPSRFGNTPLFPRLRLGTSGSITKPLRNRWVFSNPTSP